MALTRALVVDDSRLARVALSKLLGRRGIEVDVAGSGEEALEYLRANAPDVVFLDYMMPDMDGMEAARAIQALPERPPLPLVMYTSQDTDDDRLRAAELGICGFLPKPTSEQALDTVLADAEAWAPPREEHAGPASAATVGGASMTTAAEQEDAASMMAADPTPAEAVGATAPSSATLEQRAGEVAAAVARETLDTQLDEARVHWQHELDRVGAELQEMLQESMQQTRHRDDAVDAARTVAEESAQTAVNEAAERLRQQTEEAARLAAVKAVEEALVERDAAGSPGQQTDDALAEQVHALLSERLQQLGETDVFRDQLVTSLTDHGIPVLKNALDQWVRERATEAALNAVEDSLRSASEVMFKEAAAAAAEAAAEEAHAAHARTRRFMLLACTVLAAGVVAALILAV